MTSARLPFLAGDDWEASLPALRSLRGLLKRVSFEVTAKLPFPGGVLDLLLDPANLRAWCSGERNLFHRSAVAGAYRWRLARRHPRAVGLHELLTIGHSITEERATVLPGGRLLDQLLGAQVLETADGLVRANVLAVPMTGLLCVCDPVRWQDHPDYVYAGRSSFSAPDYLSARGWLASGRAKAGSRRLLDLGCGAGFAAVAAAAGGVEQVLGSDVIERCLRFARVNAALNDLRNLDFVRSDLFEDIEGDFDFVIANTPCAWDEVQQATFATGGAAFGTELPLRMVSGSLQQLRPDGILVVVMAAPIIAGRPYVYDAVAQACGDRPIDVHIQPLMSEYEYGHAATYRRHDISQFVRYLITMSPGDRLSITVNTGDRGRFACYQARAAAARLAASLTRRAA